MAVHEQLRLEPCPEPPRARTEANADAALDAISAEAVARRVVELMRVGGGVPSARRLVDAGTLAAEFGVTRSWVYEHRDELGAVRIGAGPKPRLRFDPEAARRVFAGSSGKQPHEPAAPASARGPAPRRRSRLGNGAGLLPIRGSAVPLDARRERS
jgi:hypothetical protein